MLEPQIIYEDENFLAINKPAGLIVHEVKVKKGRMRQKEATLVDWLLRARPEIANVGDDPLTRPGIVHRLDRDTSGILLIPKTQAYFDYLKNLFTLYEVKKQYIAIVCGNVKEKKGVIDKPIGIISGTLRRSVHTKKMLKTAITEYVVTRHLMIAGEEATMLRVYPKTGRTHQIRIHLALIGHPIVGDRLYGKKHSLLVTHQLLHAESVEFAICPGKMVKLEAKLPATFKF
ncbi:MAG TPA: RluA family pseudouridine synthase [Candidatus Paceibacterota bacterium]